MQVFLAAPLQGAISLYMFAFPFKFALILLGIVTDQLLREMLRSLEIRSNDNFIGIAKT